MTLMGLGLAHTEASSYVCAAMAEDKSGCLAATVIARKAYSLYLSQPAPEESEGSPLLGLKGYESVQKAGWIENAL